MPITANDLAFIHGLPKQSNTPPPNDDRSEQQRQLDQINGVTPVATQPEPEPKSEDIKLAPPGNDWNFIRESLKRGAATTAGFFPAVTNWAINRIAPSKTDVLPGFQQSLQNFQEAFGVDAEAIERGASTTPGHFAGKFAEYAMGTPLNYVRYAKPAMEAIKPGANILGTIKNAGGAATTNLGREARNLPKNLSVAEAAGVGSELGGHLGGGITEAVTRAFTDDEDQVSRMAQSGKIAGNIAGGGVAAPTLGATRYNAIAETAKKVGGVGTTRFEAATEAARAAWKAKRDGDKRAITDIMFENYGLLRSGSDIGSIQRGVNERMADIIRQNPDAKLSLEDFAVTMDKIKNDALEQSYSLGARTNDPTILRLETQRRIDLPEEQARNAQDRTRREELVRLYKDNLDGTLPVGKKAVETSLEQFRLQTLDDITNFEMRATAEKKAVPNLGPVESQKTGSEFRAILDDARKQSKAINEKNYAAPLNEMDAAGGIDLSSIASVTTPILKQLTSQVQPTPSVLLARRLDDLIKGNGAESKIETPGGAKAAPKAKAREVHDLQSDIGEQAHAEYGRGDTVAYKQLSDMQTALRSQLEKHPGYKAAQERYATEHVPAFKQGLNRQMDREAGGARQGLDAIPDEQVLFKYLEPSKIAENMQLFELAFGGKSGIPPQPRAYEILGEGLSTLFSREVLNGKVTDEAVNAFMQKYEPALKLMPQTSSALHGTASKMMAWQGAQDLAKQRYEYMLKEAPIASKIGEKQAAEFFSALMSDPARLRRVLAPEGQQMKEGLSGTLTKGEPGLFGTPKKAQELLHEFLLHAAPVSDKTGSLNYANFDKMMTLGQRTADSPGTLRILADAAYGPERGAKFVEDLQTVSEAFKRDIPDPRLRRLADPSPEMVVGGQTPASHISQLNAVLQGRIGSVYYPVIAGSRFMNARIQGHIREAESRALHDPEMMAAIAELARTPGNRPVSAGAIDKIFGMSADFVKTRLLDQHLLLDHVRGGASIGAAQAGVEENDRKNDGKKPPKRKTTFGE